MDSKRILTENFVRKSLAVYDQLLSTATEEEIDDITVKVFRGSVLDAYRATRISNSMYSKIFRFLYGYEFATLLQRGSSGTLSVVVLHSPPNPDKTYAADLTGSVRGARVTLALEDRIERLENQQGGIDIRSALAEIEGRLKKAGL